MKTAFLSVPGALVLAFLVLPVLIIVPLSFSTGPFLGFPLRGLGLRWYETLLASDFWRQGLENSLILAAGATVCSTLLGTPAALGLWRARFRGRGVVMGLILAPIVVPAIVTAVALTLVYGRLGLTGSLAGLIVAHTAMTAPFVVITLLAALSRLDPLLGRAAAASGAAPFAAFLRVTLPLAAPGIAAGAAFACAVSLDESVVALFLAGPGQRTLPRQMFAAMREAPDPTILAAATLLAVLSVALLAAAPLLRRRAG